MMIFTKGRYALRFLADVAEHQGDGFVPLRNVAVRRHHNEYFFVIQRIIYSFVEYIRKNVGTKCILMQKITCNPRKSVVH